VWRVGVGSLVLGESRFPGRNATFKLEDKS